mmetsp:Transcript_17089/g.33452  ORF Transcript_17089/g.33452 Transcript_17089/m.33452 type:complete len:548 (+) Transcript_17089:255-1898(+)
MASFTAPVSTMPDIACCMCGVAIQPNDVNMCLQCLKDRVDVTEGISRQEVIWTCSGCGKTRAEEGRWLMCEPESAELLALCLKAVHGLGKGKGKGQKSGARFVDAAWIWTEPHSRRLKIKITVEKEVFNSAIVRQRLEVEFIVKSRLCPECVKETTDQQWTTVIQVRQQVSHKRTLLNLENKLLRGGAAKSALDVIPVNHGLDFYFANKTQANKFTDFVMSCVPARRKESKSLQGADLKSNKYNYRHSIHIEVVPLCKHDFIILPVRLQQQLFGGKSSSVIVESVTRTINLVDPFTGARAKLQDAKYWANAFRAVGTARQFTEFTVLDCQPLSYGDSESENAPVSEVDVARLADLGLNDERFTVFSHIGHRLEAGDTVLGYDFANHNISDELLAPLKGRELEPVILVQKVLEKVRKPRKLKKKKGKKAAAEGDAREADLEDEDGEVEADDAAEEGEDVDFEEGDDEEDISFDEEDDEDFDEADSGADFDDGEGLDDDDLDQDDEITGQEDNSASSGGSNAKKSNSVTFADEEEDVSTMVNEKLKLDK